MKLTWQWVNGLVFGVTHSYYVDFDSSEEATFEERFENSPRRPMINIFIGPIQIIVVW